MLIGLPRILSPELMLVLMEMGHGDELVIGDANFPAHSIARAAGGRVVHIDAAGIVELLDAILTLLPLDYAVRAPVLGMAWQDAQPAIHDEFRRVLTRRGYEPDRMELLSKADFYERAKHGYAVLASGEPARFANLILRKGVIG